MDVAALAAAPDGAERLAAAIAASAPQGVMLLANALPAPFEAIGELFGRVTPEAGARANAGALQGWCSCMRTACVAFSLLPPLLCNPSPTQHLRLLLPNLLQPTRRALHGWCGRTRTARAGGCWDAALGTCCRVDSVPVQAGGGTACAVRTLGGHRLPNQLLTAPPNRGGPHVDYKRVIDLSPHRVDDLTA